MTGGAITPSPKRSQSLRVTPAMEAGGAPSCLELGRIDRLDSLAGRAAKKMFQALKRDWTLLKLNRALNRAATALTEGQIATAKPFILEAFKIIQRTNFCRTQLINLITGWRLMGHRLKELGAPAIADECQWAADLLQARFDSGDYWPDPE